VNRELLICTICKRAIFVDSPSNQAPRWTGNPGDPPNERIEIEGQDDLRVFTCQHLSHDVMEVELVED
jgi:hypothetical protein